MRNGVSRVRAVIPCRICCVWYTLQMIVTLGILTRRASLHSTGPLVPRARARLPAFSLLARIGEREGVRIVLGRLPDFDFQRRRFQRAWIWKSGRWIVGQAVPVDRVLFQMKGRRASYRYGLTPKRLNDLYRDKWRTYQRFWQWSPRTWLVHSRAQAERTRGFLHSERFVIKPRWGSGSRGVFALPSDRPIQRRIPRNTILQEYVEPIRRGPLAGNRIYRVILLDGAPALSYAKVGKRGQTVVGVSKGATRKVLPMASFAPNVRRMLRAVDQRLRPLGRRFYSNDFRIDPAGRPVLIELNGMPDWPSGRDAVYRSYYAAFCRFVVRSVRRSG